MSNGNGAQTFPLDVATLRLLFAAFADDTAFPDAVIQVWLDLAATFVNTGWGPMQAFGQGLWAAHELAKMTQAAQPGTSITGITGIPSNKSVDSVSIGYDTTTGTVDGAGSYNLTVYGRQWYQLAMVFGMGPFQFGPPEWVSTGQAPWMGPPNYLNWDI
jgi:hypothetical protein